MNSSTRHSDNITMAGGGEYSLATIGAKHVIDAATPMVTDAIAAMDLGALEDFCLSDMGCADGGTSMEMVTTALKAVRGKTDIPVRVVYADQPGNDYNALCNNIYGQGSFGSWLGDVAQAFPFMSGTSFYDQIVPDNTLNLGFSATAMHWLSSKPCNISGHVQGVGATGDDRKRFAAQGATDWQTILMHRAAELRPGGRLVLMNFGVDEQGRYLGNTGGVNMFDRFNEIWQQFVDDGIITGAEYDAMTLPQYYNTVEEFRAPFDNPDSAVSQAGLKLEHVETRVVRCPYAEDFERHGDSARFAAEYIPTIKSWNQSIFAAGLDESRGMDARREIIENYYGTYETQVREQPAGHAMDYVHCYLVIQKA